MKRTFIACWASLLLSFWVVAVVHVEKQYGPGVTDTEIKIGQTL